MSSQNGKILFFFIFSVYLLLVLSQIIEFHLWPQVNYIHSAGLDINVNSIYNHAHALRYSLVFPIYLISDAFSLDQNISFSLLVVFLMTFIVLLLSNAVISIIEIKNFWLLSSILFILFICISLFMNGRLIFGLLSYSLAIYGVFLLLDHRENKNDLLALLLITLALYISSVTSGISISLYLVLFSFLTFIFLGSFYYSRARISTFANLYLLGLFLIYTPIVMLLLNKNINYFGGGFEGVVAMTDHGSVLSFNSQDEDAIIGLSIPRILELWFSFLLVFFIYFFHKQLRYDLKLLFITYLLFAIILLSSFSDSILMMGLVPSSIIITLLCGPLKLRLYNIYKKY